MNTTRRPLRYFWLLGILLLVGTAIGAGWVLNNAPAQDKSARDRDKDRDRGQPGADMIICLGRVDVEGGLTPLHPLQGGRVTHLWVREGDPVSEGEMLLSVDDRLARAQLKKAKADLKAAEDEKRKVERLRDTHKDDIKLQEDVVEAARANARAQGHEVAIQRDLFKKKAINSDQLGAYEEKEKALQALVRVEEGRLRKLKAYEFGEDLARAGEQIKAKEAVVEEARLALLECDVYAPADGTVLHLQATVGEPLSREPRAPAIQFCPNTPRIIRAEVQQEWASRVEVGQAAIVEDETRASPQWQGRVKYVSDWFTRRRSQLLEPFQYNDVRTLECIVSVNAGARHLRMYQHVRVLIKQGGP
jgi:multidrug resistance efflux pump